MPAPSGSPSHGRPGRRGRRARTAAEGDGTGCRSWWRRCRLRARARFSVRAPGRGLPAGLWGALRMVGEERGPRPCSGRAPGIGALVRAPGRAVGLDGRYERRGDRGGQAARTRCAGLGRGCGSRSTTVTSGAGPPGDPCESAADEWWDRSAQGRRSRVAGSGSSVRGQLTCKEPVLPVRAAGTGAAAGVCCSASGVSGAAVRIDCWSWRSRDEGSRPRSRTRVPRSRW